jgi:hypothetical protein
MLKPKSTWGKFEGEIAELAKDIIEQEVIPTEVLN